MKLDLPADHTDRQAPNEQSIRNHEGEDQEAQNIEPPEYETDRHDDKEEHQAVEKGARGFVFPPPVVGFDRADRNLVAGRSFGRALRRHG